MSMFNGGPAAFGRVNPLGYSQADEMSLGRFMNNVYAWMCAGLAMTAAVAYLVAQNVNVYQLRGAGIILFIVEIGLVIAISSAINRISATVATGLFLAFAALNGVSLSVIFLGYSMPNIGGAFVVAAGMFGATSLFGYVTKKDLTSLGGFLFMGLIGIVIASIVNMFLANSTLYWIITYAGVALFVGLTAYDTQRLKNLGYQLQGNGAMASRMAIVGSLMLYLDFINLFLFLLQAMNGGSRRR